LSEDISYNQITSSNSVMNQVIVNNNMLAVIMLNGIHNHVYGTDTVTIEANRAATIMPRSNKCLWIQIIFATVQSIARYSALVEDIETVVFLLDFQGIRFSPKWTTYSIVDDKNLCSQPGRHQNNSDGGCCRRPKMKTMIQGVLQVLEKAWRWVVREAFISWKTTYYKSNAWKHHSNIL